MRTTEKTIITTARRVRDFLDKNPELFAAVNQMAIRKELDEIVDRLSGHATDQVGGRAERRGETANQRALRLALRVNHMRAIAALARKKLRDVPNLRALELPDHRLAGQRVVAAGNAMAQAATQYKQVFLDAGFPTDFVAQLQAATDEVRKSLDAQSTNMGRQVGGTAGLGEEASRAREVIRVIDTFVVPLLQKNLALLQQWRSAKHVERRPLPSGTAVQPAGSAGVAAVVPAVVPPVVPVVVPSPAHAVVPSVPAAAA